MREILKKFKLIKIFYNLIYANIFTHFKTIYLGLYTLFRTLKYSNKRHNVESIKSSLRTSCHIIEKGLTMPKTRLGFGQDRVFTLINQINSAEKYENIKELETAVGILKNYDLFHKANSFKLDKNLQDSIDSVLRKYLNINTLEQLNYQRDEFFLFSDSNFSDFSNSRRSVRNFEKKASREQIEKSFSLALESPAACNRQLVKYHIYEKEADIQNILKCQNGNRGFNHLIPQVCIITVDLNMMGKNEQNDVYFNAGLFAMSLVYAFHHNKVACCMLNWAVGPKEDKLLRAASNIPIQESIAVLIAFGIPSKEINIAKSDKKPLMDSLKFHL